MAENVNLIGAIASIIALLIAAGTIVYKLVTKYRRIKVESEQQYQDQYNRYETASRTIGARTDLGFFLLNTLGKYRTTIITYNILFATGILCGFILVASTPDISDIMIPSAFLVVSLIFLAFMTAFLMILIFRYERLEHRFNEYFQRLWETPIQKHVDRQTRSSNKANEG